MQMDRKNLISMALVLLLVVVTGCNDPYNSIDGKEADYVNNDNKNTPTALDNWLYDNFTAPYNIDVKYRWDGSELDPYKNLVPPKVDKIQGVMEVIRHVWIDPYTTLAGADFIKVYCPKQFVLVGSANYNFDGSTVLGTAEGGRKVLLYVINRFDPDDYAAVKNLIHTVEHEFGHILNQNISYPSEFKEITAGSYTGNWATYSDASARAMGFITSYAMASPDEDFVEMIAMMLVEGKAGYERILSCETNAASRALIRKKEQAVVAYFQKSYHMDFYALQTEVQKAIAEVADVPPVEEKPPVFDQWGFGKPYTSVRFDLNFMAFPPGFAARFVSDYNKLAKEGYGLDTYFRLFIPEEGYMTLQLYYHTIGDGDRQYFTANFQLQVYNNDDGSIKLFFFDADANARDLIDKYDAVGLLDYFAGYSYVIDWERSSCPDSNYVGFYPVDLPNAGYAFGVLGN